MCPNCGKLMKAKWRKTVVGEKDEGRAKFWVCKPCDIRFKIGGEVIRRKEKVLSEDEVRKNLGLPPKDVTVSSDTKGKTTK